jgi:hypothetical protein
MRTAAALACAFLLCGVCGNARAEERCAPIAGGDEALTAFAPAVRLAFVQRRLNADARRVRIWAWSWAGIYSGLIAFNATELGRASTHSATIDYAFGTAGSMLGLAVIGIMPPAVLRDQPRLARIVERSRFEADRCALVAAAEHILLRDAASEAFGRGPLVHVGGIAFNLGLGILLGAGFGHWSTGGIVALTGIAAAELQAATVRTRIGETLSRYRRGQLDDLVRPPAPIAWTIVPMLDRRELGLSAALKF